MGQNYTCIFQQSINWSHFMSICTTMDQHWANDVNPTLINKLSCQCIICWTNVGPTLYVKQSISHVSCQHLLQWTNIGPTSHTQHRQTSFLANISSVGPMLGQRLNSDANSRPTIQPTTNVGPMQSCYLGCLPYNR